MNKKINSHIAALLVIAAGILWGTISIFVNALSKYNLNSMEMGILRIGICTVILFFVILIYKPALFKIKLKDIWMFIGTGLLSLVFFSWCYFNTIINANTSVAVSLLYTSPVWVMIFSAILFKEKLNLQKIIAVPITVIGCLLITELAGSNTTLTPAVILTGLGAGIGYALYSVFGRYATEKYNSLTITFYTFLFASFGFLCFTNPVQLINKCTQSPKIIIPALLIGIICSLLPYIFYTIGLNNMETSVAAILVAVEPLVGCVIGITVFKDSLSASKTAGIVLILSSIIILNLNFKRKKLND